MRASPDGTPSGVGHGHEHATGPLLTASLPPDPVLPDAFPSDPFLSDLGWSAQDLIDAVRWSPPPLHRFDFAPSANDAANHRPRRGNSFLAMPQWPSRFRIGG